MKFPPTHHRKIVETINKHGFVAEQFSFVKRKGWVHILKDKEYFAYFRKKETRLHKETKKWINSAYFKIRRSDGITTDVMDLKELIEAFDDWLRISR